MSLLYYDPCWWSGHDYRLVQVTAERRQCYACVRCGAAYQAWTSTNADV
jgi:hypothetical protein